MYDPEIREMVDLEISSNDFAKVFLGFERDDLTIGQYVGGGDQAIFTNMGTDIHEQVSLLEIILNPCSDFRLGISSVENLCSRTTPWQNDCEAVMPLFV